MKNMMTARDARNYLTALIVALATLTGASADGERVSAAPQAAPRPFWTASVTTALASNYCWSLGGATRQASWQTELTAAFVDPTGGISPFVGVLAISGPGFFGSEYDLYFGGVMPVATRTTLTAAMYYYVLEPLGNTDGDLGELVFVATHQVSRQWSAEAGLRLMQPFGVDLPLRPFLYGGAAWQGELGGRLSGLLRQRVAYDTGVYAADAGWLARTTARVDYDLGGRAPNYRVGLLGEWAQPIAGIQDRQTELVLATQFGATW